MSKAGERRAGASAQRGQNPGCVEQSSPGNREPLRSAEGHSQGQAEGKSPAAGADRVPRAEADLGRHSGGCGHSWAMGTWARMSQRQKWTRFHNSFCVGGQEVQGTMQTKREARRDELHFQRELSRSQ